jgi:glucose-1-phosphate adenylyltransferase
MGIYVFSRDFLFKKLVKDAEDKHSAHDFGKNIIPSSVSTSRVAAYMFRDSTTGKKAYWRDVGTIDAYYEANMGLMAVTPGLNLYDKVWPIYTYQDQVPPAKMVFDDEGRRGMAVDSLVASGCILSGGIARHSLLSTNVQLHSYSRVEDCILLPNSEVGRSSRLKKVILDQDCKLPPKTVIGYDPGEDAKHFYVSPEGVVLVSRQMLMDYTRTLNHVA